MSITSALISVVSAMSTSFLIFFLLCAAQRFTYSARTTVGPVGCCARRGKPPRDASAKRPAVRRGEIMRGTVDCRWGYRKLAASGEHSCRASHDWARRELNADAADLKTDCRGCR